MSGTPSPKQSSSSGSAASFIKKGVQQLIDSDDDQVLTTKMYSLQESFPFLKRIHAQMTNTDKLLLFLKDNLFRHRLCQKLLEQFGTEKIPTIKLHLYSTRYRSLIEQELDQNDLVKILQKFGKISLISLQKTQAYVRFDSLLSSYLAIQILNGFQIVSDFLRLSVAWCKPQEQILAQQLFYAQFNSITKAFGNHQTSEKYNAKYQIHLACPLEFKLPQKIIGPKGNNLKKVFESISQQQKIASIEQLQKNLKIRLRGKGSGHCEGPNGEQSDEILNLCVSSKQKKLYESACKQIEKIIQKLANDYKFQFQKTYKRLLQGIIFQKYELQMENYKLTSELRLEQLLNNLNDIDENRARKMTVHEIEQQMSLRNKARKNGKFQEADQIRDRLKKKGILLIDGTGKKNCYTTTWSFIGE